MDQQKPPTGPPDAEVEPGQWPTPPPPPPRRSIQQAATPTSVPPSEAPATSGQPAYPQQPQQPQQPEPSPYGRPAYPQQSYPQQESSPQEPYQQQAYTPGQYYAPAPAARKGGVPGWAWGVAALVLLLVVGIVALVLVLTLNKSSAPAAVQPTAVAVQPTATANVVVANPTPSTGPVKVSGSAIETVQGFYQAVKSHDFNLAYTYLSTDLAASTTPQQMQTNMAQVEAAGGTFQNFNIQPVSTTENTAEVLVEETTSSGATTTEQVSLEAQNGKWVITGFTQK